MVSGISGSYPTHGPSSGDNNLTPYQRDQLWDARMQLDGLIMQISWSGLSNATDKQFNSIKENIQAILDTKPPPSPQIASQCKQILDDINAALQAKDAGNKESCIDDLQKASKAANSLFGQ